MYISENVSACQNGLTSLARGIFARFFFATFTPFVVRDEIWHFLLSFCYNDKDE